METYFKIEVNCLGTWDIYSRRLEGFKTVAEKAKFIIEELYLTPNQIRIIKVTELEIPFTSNEEIKTLMEV